MQSEIINFNYDYGEKTAEVTLWHHPKAPDRFYFRSPWDEFPHFILCSRRNDIDKRTCHIGSTISMYHPEIFQKLASLHDSEGSLEVNWIHDPSEADKKMLEHFWESHNECLVEHFYPRMLDLDHNQIIFVRGDSFGRSIIVASEM